jgi:hypothetical protein
MVDLAFMISGWSTAEAAAGRVIAQTAYGDSVDRAVAAVATKMRNDRAYRNRCVDGLAIADTKTLVAGLDLMVRGKW